MELSAPRTITFVVAILIAIAAVIIHYANIAIPHVHSGFVILLIGFLVLVAGNLLRGVQSIETGAGARPAPSPFATLPSSLPNIFRTLALAASPARPPPASRRSDRVIGRCRLEKPHEGPLDGYGRQGDFARPNANRFRADRAEPFGTKDFA